MAAASLGVWSGRTAAFACMNLSHPVRSLTLFGLPDFVSNLTVWESTTMNDKKDGVAKLQELSETELVTVKGGARKWCCRNGRWYVCGQGKRPG